MKKSHQGNKTEIHGHRKLVDNYTTVSNITGGITDEEFADEFLAYPKSPNQNGARYQFNFLGAELEKVDSAKLVRNELKKQP